MSFFDGYNVATSGMSAQRTRINVVSSNIANAKTINTPEGGPYKKKQVVFEEMMMSQNNKTNTNDVEKSSNGTVQNGINGVAVNSIVQSEDNPIMKYEPSHPQANEQGYVAYPNINPVVEMVDLIEAMRSYEANVATFNTHKNIDSKTIEILNA